MTHLVKPELHPQIPVSPLLGRRGKPYHAEPGLIAAANVALTLERPLLLTGEPGCGKSDFAWAAAQALGEVLGYANEERVPLQCYVRSDTRARDMLYTYDAVRRFGDAQNGGPEGLERAKDPRNYIELQALGLALASPRRRVVLIDEIDKAPRDLPNDLLRELEQNTFDIPEIPVEFATRPPVLSHGIALQRSMERRSGADGVAVSAPLLIITSNVERQLPDAFLRRCVFWHIKFPEELLADIVADHLGKRTLTGELMDRALAVYKHVRAAPGLSRKPGTAELLDWMMALTSVFHSDTVSARIRHFSDAIKNGARGLKWGELPGLGCLVKMREDQDRLSQT